MLLCYAIIILMLILFNDVCFYYFSARWEVEASMMMIGQCANKVSVCFVKRSPRSCAGLIFCTDQLLYSLSLFYFSRGVANAHAKHRNGVPEGLPMPTAKHPTGVYETPNLYVFLKAFSDIAN